jgi:copper chaperone
MIQFEVADMTCGHCASRITNAVRSVDPEGRCEVDVNAGRVRISSGQPAARFLEAIREAGYSAMPIADGVEA